MSNKFYLKREFLDLLITNKCPNECLHCAFNCGEKYIDELSTEDIKTAFKNIKEFFCVSGISLSGGEPFSRSDFLEIYEFANIMYDVNLITTGIGFSNDIYDVLIKAPPKRIISSLYGFEKKHNNFCDNAIAFKSLINFLNACKSIETNIALNIICYNSNLYDVFNLITFIHDNSLAHEVKLLPLSPIGRGRNLAKELINGEDWINFIQNLREMLINEKISFKKTIKYEDHIGFSKNIRTIKCPIIYRANAKLTPCVHIDSVGDIYPCTMFVNNKKFILGNILEYQKIEIDKVFMKMETQYNELMKKNCKVCMQNNFCSHGCFGYHVANGHDYRCNLNGFNIGCPDWYSNL